jgi:hypothetical protein
MIIVGSTSIAFLALGFLVGILHPLLALGATLALGLGSAILIFEFLNG